MNTGWACPKCQRCFAPHVSECAHCAHRGLTPGISADPLPRAPTPVPAALEVPPLSAGHVAASIQ